VAAGHEFAAIAHTPVFNYSPAHAHKQEMVEFDGMHCHLNEKKIEQ